MLSKEPKEVADTVIYCLGGMAASLLFALVTRDFGIQVSGTLFSSCIGCRMMWSNKKKLISNYGYFRRSSDNLMNAFLPNSAQKEVSVNPVLMVKVESPDEQAKNKWTTDFPDKDLISMIQEENEEVNLKIRFKNGAVKVVKINA